MAITDLPEELEGFPVTDTAEDRVAASGVPYPWSWDTAPPQLGRFVLLYQRWARTNDDRVPRGAVLHGPPGTGKTGVACSIVRDAAERRVGSSTGWVVTTAPRVLAAVREGGFRPRPAPAQFYRWRTLKAALDLAKIGASPWVENPPVSAEKLLAEIEERCVVLALDDVDVDAHTAWKEEVLLRLLEAPRRGQRLVLTMNVDPDSRVGVERLGERVCDRLMARGVFGLTGFHGASLRRGVPGA